MQVLGDVVSVINKRLFQSLVSENMLSCEEKKIADVHTLAQIMNWGQKCKKARSATVFNDLLIEEGRPSEAALVCVSQIPNGPK